MPIKEGVLRRQLERSGENQTIGSGAAAAAAVDGDVELWRNRIKLNRS